jgi:hypothetical protein
MNHNHRAVLMLHQSTYPLGQVAAVEEVDEFAWQINFHACLLVEFFACDYDGFAVINCNATAFEKSQNFFFSFLAVLLEFLAVASKGGFDGAGVAGFEFFLELA